MDAALDAIARPLTGEASDYDALIDLVGDACFVLIGEASHGTHEFYAERVAITKRLIVEKGFGAVCIEGDWPDAYRVDCYVKDEGDDRSAAEALEGFRRFPTWMWRNEVVRDFVEWLRGFNAVNRERKVGFHGLDLYSLFGSIQAIVTYLDRVDPQAAQRARHRYACFEHFGDDAQAYGYATATRMTDSCEQEAIRQLLDLQAEALEYVNRDGVRAVEDFFSAEQNARLIRNAERYYRSMYRGRVSSWNLRDRHMAETLDALARHLAAQRKPARLVVWAHNSHLGDARYTDMRRRHEINLGQLVREAYGHDDVRLIGFSTNSGTVTAAHDWDEPGRQMRVRPALPDSYEHLFAKHSARREMPAFCVPLRNEDAARDALGEERLQRAIGVVYRPETERMSHYYPVELSRQFDAIIHVDDTTALRALEPGDHWHRGVEEVPETFPTGF